MELIIVICEDSLEGIFTAIYEAYERKYVPDMTEIQIGEEGNQRLFATYQTSLPSEEKSQKVARTILREFGVEVYYDICRCLASEEKKKAQAVYQTIAIGLKMERKSQLMGFLQNPFVRTVFELSRSTNNEILHWEGFLRFHELENGLMFSKIKPKNNILTFLAPHFSDRFPGENFVIMDDERQLFIVHPAFKKWMLVAGEYPLDEAVQSYSEKEKEYQELFIHFCNTISIKERENRKLQRQMLPIRFQKYMVEFLKK